MQEFQLHSEQRTQLIDITPQVNDAVAASGLREGLCNIFAPHTTAAVIVSENWDPDVSADLLGRLQAIIPQAIVTEKVIPRRTSFPRYSGHRSIFQSSRDDLRLGNGKV